MFFVISGFTTWHTARHLDPGRFVYLRLTRIYIGYWLAVLLAALLLLVIYPTKLAQLNWPALLFLDPTVPLQQTILPVAWTLSFEPYFYALFALFLAAPRRTAAAVVAALVGVSVSLSLFRPETFAPQLDWLAFLFSPLLLEFFAGVAVGAVATHFHQSRHPWAWIGIGAVGLIGSSLAAHLAGVTTIAFWELIPLRVLLLGPWATALVYGAVCLESVRQVACGHGNARRRLLRDLPPAHPASVALVLPEPSAASRSAIAFTSFGGVVCLIVVLSVLHYRWIEVPMLRLSRKPVTRLVPVAAT